MKKKVVIAMSGGVDSSVAAALLQKQNYDVIGIMLNIWSEDHITNKCCSLQASEDARIVAGVLNIPFYIRNYRQFFKENVVNYFLENSQKGYTPNPCFFCNQKVRFGQLLAEALRLGADYLATGHYVKLKKEKEEYQLFQAKDKNKDQSYMLHRLNQQQLAHCLFPLGDLEKPEVKKIAQDLNLPVFQKKESQDLCFLGKDGVKGFFQRQAKEQMQAGDIVNAKGELLGKHQGLMAYTIGQRRGLGISAQQPLFVIDRDFKNNRLVVGFQNDRAKKSFSVENCHFVNGKIPQEQVAVTTKIRYKSEAKESLLYWSQGHLRVEFQESAEDISPGQGAVFYQKEKLLGGAIISQRV